MFFVKDVHISFKKGALPSKTNDWIRKENFLISLNRIYIWIRNQTLSQEGRNFRLRKVKGCSQSRLLGVVFKLLTSGLPIVAPCSPLGFAAFWEGNHWFRQTRNSGMEIFVSDKRFLVRTTDFKNVWKCNSSLIHPPCHKVANLIRNDIVDNYWQTDRQSFVA